ncbi:HAMP domain-containing histidine kinase (plasmid) [Adhaeribacter swui]|uniref:histidine kinase n=1 Tax=Adhaeribacter swui TaxID=2086471 RepID=A0A7G7G222_9BACT|nr:HAMP domain-containing sensor histidine kinase [Adhaeribacter swui]QNF31206.1 HAMP domain-containing histidine kinase [Adhaeribacter swui]
MNQLLNRTLLYYAFLATTLLLLSAPLFYSQMQRLYIDDVDEAINLRREEFQRYHLPLLQKKEVAIWNKYNRDIWILPDTITQPVGQIQEAVFLDTLHQEWEPYRVLYDRIAINRQPFMLRIRINLVESEDLIKALVKLYIGLLVVLSGVLFVLTRVVSKRLWKPFYDTLHQIEKFNIEQPALPVFPDTAIMEFKQLNTGLISLINANLKAYQRQKEFTENAAHELQTPLAVFQSKLDLLLQHPSLLEEQAAIIASLYETASRLSRINKNLLLLAKLGSRQFYERQAVEVGTIITEVLPYFTEQAQQKNLHIQTHLPDQPVWVQAHKGLLEIMIHNLFLNAIRHNVASGSISLHLIQKQLTINNTGETIPLEEELLFERFAKTSSHVQSSGLGLAIVHQICQLHGWQVMYQFPNQQHQFTVNF